MIQIQKQNSWEFSMCQRQTHKIAYRFSEPLFMALLITRAENVPLEQITNIEIVLNTLC